MTYTHIITYTFCGKIFMVAPQMKFNLYLYIFLHVRIFKDIYLFSKNVFSVSSGPDDRQGDTTVRRR